MRDPGPKCVVDSGAQVSLLVTEVPVGNPGPKCVVDSGAQVSLLVTEVPVGNPGPKCVVASAAGVLLTPVPKLVYLLPRFLPPGCC